MALVPVDGQARCDSGIDASVARELVAHGRTRTVVAETLVTLQKAGLLNDTVSETDQATLKRKLGKVTADHAKTHTPYGCLVQSMQVGDRTWEYLHPFAFLYHMSMISADFATMMRSACADGRHLKLVLFADGMVPGNPFRPEKSRTVMCLYWCLADWPQHVLQRSFAWPVFSILRESIIEKLSGGLSGLMRKVLRVFFPLVGHSFSRGVTINSPQGAYVAKAVFAGFLGDLVGHKDIWYTKGHNGVKCCMN